MDHIECDIVTELLGKGYKLHRTRDGVGVGVGVAPRKRVRPTLSDIPEVHMEDEAMDTDHDEVTQTISLYPTRRTMKRVRQQPDGEDTDYELLMNTIEYRYEPAFKRAKRQQSLSRKRVHKRSLSRSRQGRCDTDGYKLWAHTAVDVSNDVDAQAVGYQSC